MKNFNKDIVGYIEGFYGKLLTWNDRTNIVNSLSKNKMNAYFYAPKEDVNHRLNWRKKYSKEWRSSFRTFAKYSKNKKIEVIAGIAPGLDFDFRAFNNSSVKEEIFDFRILYDKAKTFLRDGASAIALLLDDIPNNYQEKFGDTISEGTSHGNLANMLSRTLKQKIFFVPRIYADELIQENPFYLNSLSMVLDPKIKVFYCGKNVVSKNLSNYKQINKTLKNKIIFWDNYYANDYCPRRLFIGPYLNRKNINNIMINPTGLINTDLLILDIFANNFYKKYNLKEGTKLLSIHGVPKQFMKIKKFFLKPDFGSNPLAQKVNVKITDFEALDFLLWKWKGELSREWYPFILGLKYDLQINKNLLTLERKIKTQTPPLSEFIIKGEFK